MGVTRGVRVSAATREYQRVVGFASTAVKRAQRGECAAAAQALHHAADWFGRVVRVHSPVVSQQNARNARRAEGAITRAAARIGATCRIR